MTFADWYKAQGYAAYDDRERGSGVNLCSRDLGVTPRYVRILLNDESKLPKTGPLLRLMEKLSDETTTKTTPPP